MPLTDKQAAAKVRAYFAALPPNSRRELKKIRAAIRAAAPDAVDTYGYSMPGMRLGGRLLVWYAAWKHHLSLYPFDADVVRRYGADGSGKGTIRFPIAEPPSQAILKGLVKLRIAALSSRD